MRVVCVGDAAAVPRGEALAVDADGRCLAVFNVDGVYYAVDNDCPHRGGPLAEGDVEGKVVVCPWHGWRWDVTTGANVNNPAVRVACFPVKVERDQLYVELP